MDPKRLRFLFGTAAATVADEFDLDDESERLQALDQYAALPDDAPARGVRMTIRAIAAAQLLGNEPPEVWTTAQRLEAGGLDSDAVLSQLTMVLGEHVTRTLDGNTFDTHAYTTALAALPLPSPDDVASRLIDTARARQGINADELIDVVVNDLDAGSRDTDLLESMVEGVCETMTDGALAWLPDDVTVHVGDLVNGRTFMHRVSDAEIKLDVLSVGFDLGWFVRLDTITHTNGEIIEQFSVEHDHLAWPGTTGWLSDYEPDTLLAITVEVTGSGLDTFDATVTITPANDEPAIDDAVVEAVRAGYDALVDEPGLPVSGEELGLWLLHHHPQLLDQPQPSLAELCTAAGLDRYGGRVAHDDTVWRHELWHQRFTQVKDMVPEPEWRHVLGRALQVLDDPDAPTNEVQAVLDDCAEPETLDALADVLFPHHHFDVADEYERDSVQSPGRLFDLVQRATTVARRPRQTATAEYLACVLYERCAQPDTAEQHLKRAVDAQPRLGPIVERYGWYLFDKGDAPGAMKYWRTLTDIPLAAATIEEFLTPAAGRKLGRNDPCWCGSGRKFKHCHQNSNELPALPDRVEWLCRKASLWIEHCVGDARRIVTEIAAARATGNPTTDPHEFAALDLDELGDLFDTALADPIVFDAALHEENLFTHFLRERSPLLPDDEQLLAATWALIDRSVHEIVSVDPGVGITTRDLATGDQHEVRERTASHTMRIGERYCARIVPDGHTHQIIGGIFNVNTGTETTVLDLCAQGDGLELCAWVAALHRPPRLVHTPGLLDDMFDRDTIDNVLADAGPADEAETIALLGAELGRQARSRWLDEHIPALNGLTPRQAANDPTRREQLERLLTDIDTNRPAASSGGFAPIEYNTPELRNELGLD